MKKGMFSKSTIALLSLILMWGCSWPIYKISLQYTPPVIFSGMRATIGGILLVILIFHTRQKIQWRKNWVKYCISALFNTIFFFGLQTVGLIFLPGGMFSILVYFQPVLLGIFAWIWLGERMTTFKISGLFIGFIGIAIVSMEGFSNQLSVIGVILGLLTAITWAFGVCFVKKYSHDVDAYWMVALQCIIGGIVLLGLGGIFEDWSEIVWNGQYISGLAYGSTFGIPIAYVIYYSLVNSGDAGKVGSFTFLVPIVSVIIGTVFLDEPFTYTLLFGLLLVVVSIYFVNFNRKIHIPFFDKKVG